MLGLNEILAYIDDEFNQKQELASSFNKTIIKYEEDEIQKIQQLKLLKIPEKAQQKVIENFPSLYTEYKNSSNMGNSDYLKLLATLQFIIDNQYNALYGTMKSYKEHLEKTQPSPIKENDYRIWREKVDLIEKALSILSKSNDDIRQEKKEIESERLEMSTRSSLLYFNEQLNVRRSRIYNAELTSLEQQYGQDVPKDVDERVNSLLKEELLQWDEENKNWHLNVLERKKNLDVFVLDTSLTAVQNTLNLFTNKSHSGDLRTGLEILEQNKDNWFVQLIINLVNFFKTIGVKDPEQADAVRNDIQWQFWKKPRHEVISSVKQSVLYQSTQPTDEDDLPQAGTPQVK